MSATMLIAVKITHPVKAFYTAPVYVTPERAEQLVLEGKAKIV
jgi:hypothetical protein